MTSRHGLLASALALTLLGCGGRGGSGLDLDRVADAPDGAWARGVAQEGERTVVELADGRRVELPAHPQRVVSTLPNLTELTAYLAGLDVLVGVSAWCDWPAEVKDKPKVAVMPPDLEGLRALRPDLVLCDATLHASSLPLLQKHLPAVLAVECRSLPHLLTTVDVLGQVFGTRTSREKARVLTRRLTAAAEEARGAARTPPLRVLIVGQPDPLNVLGPGSLLDDLLRLCGAVNVAQDLGRASGPFSVEAVIERKPDWILSTGDPLSDDLRRRWAGVPAVKAGHLASADADDLLRPGPRTPEALARLAAVLRGDLPAGRLGESP